MKVGSQLHASLGLPLGKSPQYPLDSRLRCEAGKMGLSYMIFSSYETHKFISYKIIQPLYDILCQYNLVHSSRFYLIGPSITKSPNWASSTEFFQP